jgi:hypothetical protein
MEPLGWRLRNGKICKYKKPLKEISQDKSVFNVVLFLPLAII